MMDPQDIFDALAAPFAFPEDVSVRVGPTNERSRREDQPLRGQPLYYINARTVMDRLDSVVGPFNWQNHYSSGAGTSIVCNIAIRLDDEWIAKADGAGPSDMEADKGALSDAFKRAAVRWGIGRYLYDIHAPWLELEKRGNTTFIRDADMGRLKEWHDEFARKAGWGGAEGVPAYRLLIAELENLGQSAREGFADQHAALIQRMPPAMKKHLLTKLGTAA